MSTENEIETGARLALAAVQAGSIIQLPDERIFAIRPTGPGSAALENLTQPHNLAPPIPTYVKQDVTVSDEASLIVYLNRFKNADSVL